MRQSHPIRDNWSVLALLGVLVLVYIGQVATGLFSYSFMTVPSQVVSDWKALRSGTRSLAEASSFITLFTSPLMHGGIAHLLGNSFFIWIFGSLVRQLVGTRWMLGLFAITAVAGVIGDVILRHESSIPSLGASGGLMGLEGAYLGLAVRWSIPNPHIWPMAHAVPPIQLAALAVFGFFLDISGVMSGSGGIAYGAHLGGFITGLFFTSFVIGRPRI